MITEHLCTGSPHNVPAYGLFPALLHSAKKNHIKNTKIEKKQILVPLLDLCSEGATGTSRCSVTSSYCVHIVPSCLLSFFLRELIWQVHRLIRREWSRQCDVVHFFFNFHYLLLPLRSSSGYSPLFPRLLFICKFPSTTCCRRQFLSNIWTNQSAILLFITPLRRTLCNT